MIIIGKLVSGDLIIGDLCEDMIEDTMLIVLTNSGGNVGLGLSGLFAPFHNEAVSVKVSKLLAYEEIENKPNFKDFVNQYKSVVSGIIIKSDLSGLPN